MRVLHITTSLSAAWGGPVAVISGLAPAFRDQGVSCTVFAPTGRWVGTDPVSLAGVESRLFPTGWLARAWAGYAPGMAEAIRQAMANHDLIHIHELWHYPHYVAAQVAASMSKPYIIRVCGEMDPWALRQKRLKKWVYMMAFQKRFFERAAAVQAVTAEEAQHIRAQGIRTPIPVIPHGVNAQTFRDMPSARGFFQRFPGLDGKRIVLFLGRIHPKKGLDLLAHAFARISPGNEAVRLVIAGPDEGHRRHIESLLATGGVLDKTVFTGMLTGKDKLAAYAAAEVFVLPSHGEVIGVSVLEALAAGLPVVITKQCQFPDVAEAEAGLIINPDLDELHDALVKVMADSDTRRAMGERGRRLVLGRYTWDAVANRMAQMYKAVLAGTIDDFIGNEKPQERL